MDALQIFLWLMVLCKNWHFSQILHFVFVSATNGCKWVRRSKIISVVNLNVAITFQCENWKLFTWGLTGAKNVLFWA